tara:strand:- start:1646 stop:2563 length:918 start_codon:yes stop_codon:yes gene_type:complete
MCGGGMSPEQRAEIDSANQMEAVNFTTPSGSQGVTNSNYATYTDSYPDLLANYNENWKDKGVSKAEFGAMHWNQSGRNEGRFMPGALDQANPVPSGGGSSSSAGSGLIGNDGPPMGPYPENNVYAPMLVPKYAPPSAQDFTAYMPRVGPYDAPIPNLGGGAPANFPQATLYPGIGEDVDPGIPNYDIGGLLYQPFTTEYQQAFVQPNIWNYEPNQFGVGGVQFTPPPFGAINVVAPEELFVEPEEDDESTRGGGGSKNENPDQSPSTIPDSTTVGPSDIRLKKNIKFLGKSNTIDISKLRNNLIN